MIEVPKTPESSNRAEGEVVVSPKDITWEKSSAALVAVFEQAAPQGSNIERKKMFGWPCAFVNGNLFAGLHRQSMLFRLSPEDQADFLRLDGASEFEPMPGRKMKGYVTLANPLEQDPKELGKWMGRSLAYASTLPAKFKKKTSAERRQGPAKKRKSR